MSLNKKPLEVGDHIVLRGRVVARLSDKTTLLVELETGYGQPQLPAWDKKVKRA